MGAGATNCPAGMPSRCGGQRRPPAVTIDLESALPGGRWLGRLCLGRAQGALYWCRHDGVMDVGAEPTRALHVVPYEAAGWDRPGTQVGGELCASG